MDLSPIFRTETIAALAVDTVVVLKRLSPESNKVIDRSFMWIRTPRDKQKSSNGPVLMLV